MSTDENLLLAALSRNSRQSLLSACRPVELPPNTTLYSANETPRFAYFITSGLASLVICTADGETAEVGVIGREGIVGGVHLLGPYSAPTNCFIQLKATALQIPIRDLQTLFQSSEEIRNRILEMAQEQVLSLSQIAGCHRIHAAEARLLDAQIFAAGRASASVPV
jgi:CRP-like cAMP-binding protein